MMTLDVLLGGQGAANGLLRVPAILVHLTPPGTCSANGDVGNIRTCGRRGGGKRFRSYPITTITCRRRGPWAPRISVCSVSAERDGAVMFYVRSKVSAPKPRFFDPQRLIRLKYGSRSDHLFRALRRGPADGSPVEDTPRDTQSH